MSQPTSKKPQGSKQTARGHASRGMWLWIWSAIVVCITGGTAWTLDSQLPRHGIFWLDNAKDFAYNTGMNEFALDSLKKGGVGAPVVVVPISDQTEGVLVSTAFTAEIKNAYSVPKGLKGGLSYGSYPRWYLARVIDNLRKLGAKAVVVDIVLDELHQDAKQVDADLARAIKQDGKVVLAATLEPMPDGSDRLRYPDPLFLSASAGMGLANLPLDQDNVMRRFTWWFKGMDPNTAEDLLLPPLGVAGAAASAGKKPSDVVKDEIQRHAFLDHPIRYCPRDSLHSFIAYFGPQGDPAGPESLVKYEDLVLVRPEDSDRLGRAIRGKVALIGNSSILEHDRHAVPVSAPSKISGTAFLDTLMPGVEVQSHVVQTSLTGRYPQMASEVNRFLLLAGCCLLMAFIGRVFSPSLLVVAASVVVAGLWVGSIHAMRNYLFYMEPVVPTMGLIMATIGESLVMYLGEHREQLRVRRQLSRHVGKGVADELTEGEWQEFGARSWEVTMLFSDLQGFTSLSEKMSSPEICAVLNQYFAVMFPILDKYGGGIDKLMGDGMMAYFGFPKRSEDHAERAVRCALEMQHALDEWQKQPENAHLPPLRTRIGVHSGEVTIGEIGYGDRVEFSVIGDVVNVASRLEGMNKDFGTVILISESTRNQAGDVAPMTYRGEATVRGRDVPMPVYSVDVPELDKPKLKPEPAAAGAK